MFEGFLGGERSKDKQYKRTTTQTKPKAFQSNRLQVVPADTLLNSRQLRVLVNRLKALMTFPDDLKHYEKIVIQTIQSFTEYVQRLPETKTGYFSNHGGILEHALERAATATAKCYRHFMPDSQAGDTIKGEYAVWLFVVFSAALYFRLGQLILKFEVKCFKQSKEIIWQPLTGSMLNKADTYQYLFLDKNYDFIASDTTKILATHLLPNDALAWITQNYDVYAVWLSLLSERWDEVGSLSGFIPEANAETILKYYEDLEQRKFQSTRPDNELKPTTHTQRDSINFLQQGLTPNKPNVEVSPQDRALLAAFKTWLQKEIANGKITLNKNKSIVQILREGVLLSYHTYFHNFIRANPQYGKWETVLHRFAHMGLIQMNSKNLMMHYHRSDSSTTQASVLFKEAGLILTKAQMRTYSTHTFTTENYNTKQQIESAIPAPNTNAATSKTPTLSTTPSQSDSKSG